jgi:hypothetical protein
MNVHLNKFGVNNSAGLCKQSRIIYKTCCSVSYGFHVNADKYDIMVRAGTFSVRSVFVNVKFCVDIRKELHVWRCSFCYCPLFTPHI